MEFLRKLIRKPSPSAPHGRAQRRASHVTPSRTQPANMPIREAPPVKPAIEPEAQAETEASIAPEAEASHGDVSPTEEGAAEKESIIADDADLETAALPLDEEAEPVANAGETPPAGLPTPPSGIPSPAPILTRQRESLTYGIASDVGNVRDNNEDACFGMQWHSITVDDRPDFGLFIVADGMGGHLDGERASGVAVQTLAAEMLNSIYVPMLRDFNSGSSPTILEALVNASEAANRAVIKRVPGGGTTLSAVATVGNLAYLVHVGDSRAYLLHQDKIEQLTTDHTLVQRLIEMNELTLEEAEHYPQKNVLYRAIGQNEQLKMERLIRPLPSGAKVVICTDGLWDKVEDEAIREIAADARSPQEACDRLVRLANDRGGADNVTVIVIKVPGDEGPN